MQELVDSGRYNKASLGRAIGITGSAVSQILSGKNGVAEVNAGIVAGLAGKPPRFWEPGGGGVAYSPDEVRAMQLLQDAGARTEALTLLALLHAIAQAGDVAGARELARLAGPIVGLELKDDAFAVNVTTNRARDLNEPAPKSRASVSMDPRKSSRATDHVVHVPQRARNKAR